MNKGEMIAAVVENTRSGQEASAEVGLNLGLEDISLRHDFKEMKTQPTDVAVAGTSPSMYAVIPTGALRVLSLKLIRSTEVINMEMRTKEWITSKSLEFLFDTYVAYREGTKLYIRPDPQASDKVRFTIASAPTFVGTGDAAVPSITGINQALVAFATAWVFDKLEIPQSADRWMRRYEVALQKAIASDGGETGLVIRADMEEQTKMTKEKLIGDGPETLL